MRYLLLFLALFTTSANAQSPDMLWRRMQNQITEREMNKSPEQRKREAEARAAEREAKSIKIDAKVTRVWKADGKSVVAKLVKTYHDSIVIKSKDKTLEILRDRLTAADKAYVLTQEKKVTREIKK